MARQPEDSHTILQMIGGEGMDADGSRCSDTNDGSVRVRPYAPSPLRRFAPRTLYLYTTKPAC